MNQGDLVELVEQSPEDAPACLVSKLKDTKPRK